MSTETHLESVFWWGSPPREGADAFRVKCRGRYLADWLGRRCDGQADRSVSATVLWQAVRSFCRQPKESVEQRAKLQEVLDRTQTHRSDSLLSFVSLAMRDHADSATCHQQQLLLEAQLHTARAALLLADDDTKDADVALALREAVRFWASTNCSSQSVHWNWPEIEVPTGSLLENVADRYLRLLSAVHRACLKFPSDSIQKTTAIPRALCELERGISWLLEMDQADTVSRYLVIPFVVSELETMKSHRQRPVVSHHGSLAVLRMTKFHSQIATADAPALPLLIADPVYRGLLTFSDDWNEHFEQAMKWAASQQSGSGSVLMYQVDFWFPALVRKSDNTGLCRRFERPVHIEGGSASLAAGLLARATLENRDIACGACVTGALAESGVLELIHGLIPKLQVFQDVLQKCLKNSLWLAGPAASEDEQALGILQQLQGFPRIHRITHPQQAYDLVTGETDLIRRYAASELNRIWSRVERFCPKWLQERLSAGLRAENFDFSHLSVLDELTMKQSVIEGGLEERLPLQGKNDSRKETDEAPKRKETEDAAKTMALDDLLARYVAERHMPCVKLLGGPGVGKTWVGLRWHLKLIAEYWRSMTGNGDAPLRSTCLPVWVTVKELQKSLMKSPGCGLTDALVDLVVERTADTLSLNASEVPASAGATNSQSISDRFRQWLSRQLNAGEALLIVDAWDERDRDEEAERVVRERLSHWVGSGRPMMMTSRQVGEYSRSGDPLDFMSREVLPWIIQAENNTLNLKEFMRCWFGPEYLRHQDALFRLEQNNGLNELCGVPQLAALTCWLIEYGKFPEGRVRSGPLLQAVVQAVLEKYASSKREPLTEDWKDAIHRGEFLELLQLLAYRTFDGSRWELTLKNIVRELNDQAYADVLSVPTPPHTIAKHIINCGLFDVVANGYMQIVHQALAEVLTAGRLLTEQTEFPDNGDFDTAIDLALRRGLLDPKWTNTWKYYAALQPSANSLIRFLIYLKKQDTLPPFPFTFRSEAEKALHNCLSEASLQPGDDCICKYSRQLSHDVGMWPPHFSHQRAIKKRWSCNSPSSLAVINLCFSNYDHPYLEIVNTALQDCNTELQPSFQLAFSLFALLKAERIAGETFWDIFRRSNLPSKFDRVYKLFQDIIWDNFAEVNRLALQSAQHREESCTISAVCLLLTTFPNIYPIPVSTYFPILRRQSLGSVQDPNALAVIFASIEEAYYEGVVDTADLVAVFLKAASCLFQNMSRALIDSYDEWRQAADSFDQVNELLTKMTGLAVFDQNLCAQEIVETLFETLSTANTVPLSHTWPPLRKRIETSCDATIVALPSHAEVPWSSFVDAPSRLSQLIARAVVREYQVQYHDFCVECVALGAFTKVIGLEVYRKVFGVDDEKSVSARLDQLARGGFPDARSLYDEICNDVK